MELSRCEFDNLSKYIHSKCGIVIKDEKTYLIHQRLEPVVNSLGFNNFTELYLNIANNCTTNLQDKVITAITTNETSFFRDNHIFESFNSYILPKLDEFIKERSERKMQRKGSKVRIWCAASSTGQEPYCIAMLIDEYVSKNRHHNIKNSDFEVLATDISSKVLAQAISGEFTTMEAARGLSSSQIERYFSKVDGKLLLNQNIRDMVEFRRLNLIEPFTMLGGFDVIFCRNVLIYFDGSTKKKIMDQFHYMLPDDGFLILGASESTYGTTDKFDPIYINTSIIYKK